jgi:hypothetical protein
MLYIIYGLILLVSFFFPLWINVVLFAINFFLPDPIPYIDEILQAIVILKKATQARKSIKKSD